MLLNCFSRYQLTKYFVCFLQMHGYDYRLGSSIPMPSHPPPPGLLGPHHIGESGPRQESGGPDTMYQPPPPGMENIGGRLPPPMGDAMGSMHQMGSGGDMMSTPDGYVMGGDGGNCHNQNTHPPNSSGGIRGENNSMILPPLDSSSGYTLSSLDAISPMGSES